MVLVVGLRNPEAEYEGTRHNVGAAAVEATAVRSGAKFKRARRGIRAVLATAGDGANRVMLALPLRSMNVAGQVVSPLMKYFDIGPAELLVVHDDIDSPFGRLRVQFGRGSGGHNGVESVIGSVGNQFWRLKMGVGRPPGTMDPADYVLRRFGSRELAGVEMMVEEAADLIEVFLSEGPVEAQQRSGEVGRP